ncbi:DUF4136 domain-containing protein [Pontibacter harenae]|uniref:DUF4136 domain-containing protein n=1 Tax=Pontibacter harenae TaxID=2894083 RepID=UPI001E484713|nr:DUF4136 domain-containing protein [Pontibacter harenae]MCC9168246.1 DUF4136 domain-containing protein [Pontibacter harenae]
MKLISPNQLLYAILLLIFSSCVASSGVVQSNTIAAPAASLAKYKTYAWYQEQPAKAPDYDRGYSNQLNNNIRRAVEEELQRKGYTKATTNPDVLVAYDVSISVPIEKDAPGTYPNGFGYSYGYMAGYRYNYGNPNLSGYRPVDLFKQGTLIIDFVDPARDMLVWRGWSEGAISNFNANYKNVQGSVERVLEKLPVIR